MQQTHAAVKHTAVKHIDNHEMFAGENALANGIAQMIILGGLVLAAVVAWRLFRWFWRVTR